jgi:uncharacterized membrane protein
MLRRGMPPILIAAQEMTDMHEWIVRGPLIPWQEATGGLLHSLEPLIEAAAVLIEVLAVAIIIIGTAIATFIYVRALLGRTAGRAGYEQYKIRLGRTLLLGLEILVAADIVRTVALEPSLTNIAILGVLVLVRTFLSWSLVVEMEHRWPWQVRTDAHRAAVELHEDGAKRVSDSQASKGEHNGTQEQ